MSIDIGRTGRRFSKSPLAVWVALVATLSLAAAPQPALGRVLPYYEEALEAGMEAFDQGDIEGAIARLRVASFGMLDDVTSLAEALTRLSLAQAAAGERQDFVATYGRISQIEDRFNAYSDSSMPRGLKAQFESRVLEWVPANTLEQSTAFARLYRQQELARIGQLLPRARTKALEEIVAERPYDPTWRLMLASAQVESGEGFAAVDALVAIQEQRPTSQRIGCLLGRARLQAGTCEATLADAAETVHRCDIRRLPRDEFVTYLECLTGAERWLEAATLVVSLPQERRQSRPFSGWEKRIARRLEAGVEVPVLPPHEAESAEPLSLAAAANEQPAAATSARESLAAAQPVSGSATNPWPTVELTSLRRALIGAKSVEALVNVAARAEALQELHPEARSAFLFIAGEAAYRASEWQLAVDYLLASGSPPRERYDLLFYLSVSLFELGRPDEARRPLAHALPGLERTPLVERYERLILGDGS